MNRREWLKRGLLAGGAPLLAGTIFADDAANGSNAQSQDGPALTLWQLPNQTHAQMMSYLLLTRDDHLIVLDGGNPGDADYLVEKIKEIHPDGRVDVWFLSHIHGDHVGALTAILDKRPNDLAIDRLYYQFPPVEWVKEREKQEYKMSVFVTKILDQFPRGQAPVPNQKWTFGDVEITALNDIDLNLEGATVNDTSIVYRVTTPKTSLLFLGDLGAQGGNRLLRLQPAEMIKADVVQMAHHGQNGVTREFYEIVRPSVCLWCAPEWLWDNNSGRGDGSGNWKTIQNRAWMDDLGVKTHYVIKDGLKKLEFD